MDCNLIPVILSGGVGSRLWPVSREQNPKQFIRLTNGQSLLQGAYLRAVQLNGVKSLITVTNSQFLHQTRKEFEELHGPAANISYILEPFGRNTAPAIAAAAIQALSVNGPDAVLLVLAADHMITKTDAFQSAVMKAIELAQSGKLVTFGIHPQAPETGYGYIEAEGNLVIRFVEKPSLESAKEYLNSGTFLWNSGIFCFKATTLIAEMSEHCPTVLAGIKKCMNDAKVENTEGSNNIWLDGIDFNHVPDISIDYAVMEKSSQVAVIPCDIGWSDIGSWLALADLQSADENGNQIQGDVTHHNTRNCIIQSPDRLIGTVGIDNLIIIDTPDALLVANKNNAQDVKHIYAQLKANSHDSYKLHQTVQRPWGSYTVLEEGHGFKLKRIEVKAGESLSLQMHKHRSEHWVVVSGVAKVINGTREIDIQTNESTYIEAGHQHRLTNPGTETCVLIEVQTGSYLGEDDIVRLDDVYGRA
jgi:mannose-1-phosphate guanylyltransferase / mannose-6-phosphate isomerase